MLGFVWQENLWKNKNRTFVSLDVGRSNNTLRNRKHVKVSIIILREERNKVNEKTANKECTDTTENRFSFQLNSISDRVRSFRNYYAPLRHTIFPFSEKQLNEREVKNQRNINAYKYPLNPFLIPAVENSKQNSPTWAHVIRPRFAEQRTKTKCQSRPRVSRIGKHDCGKRKRKSRRVAREPREDGGKTGKKKKREKKKRGERRYYAFPGAQGNGEWTRPGLWTTCIGGTYLFN